jgi:hypothetical protein
MAISQTNVICNQTLNVNKIHHRLQKRKDKEWGAMTPQEGKVKGGLGGSRGLNEDNIILILS